MVLPGCGHGLPTLSDRQASSHIVAGSDSPLGRAYSPPSGNSGLTGVALLSDPTQALASRVLLARAAQQGLDVQVYIWEPDVSGHVLLHELRRAAQRGVRVRLLIDDNGSAGMDIWLQALAAQPGVEVRLFNPFRQRTFKAMGYLTDFNRLNHRMHNKSFTADSQATIVGGRNVGDVYYGVNANVLFSDLDLLAIGPAAQTTAVQFDGYWNSPLAYPLQALVSAVDPAELARLQQQMADLSHMPEAALLLARLQKTPWLTAPVSAYPLLQWAPVQVLSDPPHKASGAAPLAGADRRVFQSLSAWLGAAEKTLDLVSPYFVPGDISVEQLSALVQKGVSVRVITNSLAATDVLAVHAGYARHRKALLAAGVQIFELKPDAETRRPKLPTGVRLGASSTASLHGKTFVVDKRQLFVGSFNLDPRSTYLNTEMGLIVDNEAMARSLAEGIDRELPDTSYRVTLASDGSLQWTERDASGERVYASEPKTGLLRRVGARVLSWLPIEGML
ncbi:phospholipase D family protein [Acidovorax sp. BL-A-41-H1]|uniref:phospholipase D family protein n=1 Tax=Acidovorax sp. BL-A-41-H1 TaxID=3421102 RepID=UPI003F7B341A